MPGTLILPVVVVTGRIRTLVVAQPGVFERLPHGRFEIYVVHGGRSKGSGENGELSLRRMSLVQDDEPFTVDGTQSSREAALLESNRESESRCDLRELPDDLRQIHFDYQLNPALSTCCAPA